MGGKGGYGEATGVKGGKCRYVTVTKGKLGRLVAAAGVMGCKGGVRGGKGR